MVACGCALFDRQARNVTVRIHEQASPALPAERLISATLPDSGLTLTLDSNPALSENLIQSAELFPTAGGAAILLRFDIHGTMRLEELTTRNRGNYLVIYLNGRPVAAWLVNRRLTNGQFLLEGDFTDEEARRVVHALNRMGKTRR